MNKLSIFITLSLVSAVAVFFVLQSRGSNVRDGLEEEKGPAQDALVVLPIAEYAKRRTFNAFGELSQAGLLGYHVGDDVEYIDMIEEEIPVVSIADGVVQRIGVASGYCGVAVIMNR